MPEQQIEEGRECAATQTGVTDDNQDQETPRKPRGFSCYSLELLKLLEE
jgi:hypothetical protein